MAQDTTIPAGGGMPGATGCEREPIHIPGSIQPHGILLVVDPDARTLLQASENAGKILSGAVEAALGRPLESVLVEGAQDLVADLDSRVPGRGTAILRMVGVDGALFNAIAHRSEGLIVLELEETDAAEHGSLDALYPQIREFVDTLQMLPTVGALNEKAAEQVRRLTGFDRVLIYRFDDQWNGTVVAEDRNEALPSYLDLRFPAADIPAQARELYRLNRLRLIPNAQYRPVPILPGENPKTGRPIDLSFSVLRSVSPVHLQYMKNMGTPASMSISIVDDGRLWGLISCHNATPRHVPAHVRTACDFLGQIVAMQVGAKVRSEDAAQRVARHAIESRLLSFMAGEARFIDGLTRHADDLMALADAEGAAVVFDDTFALLGNCPREEQVREIVAWLSRTQPHDEVFRTDSLASLMPGAEAFADRASGLLAVSVSQLHPSYLIWFRPEVVRTVSWGGDPRKGEAAGTEQLTPRRSFEMWKETVRQRSLPFTTAEIDTAGSLRNAIVGIVMRKAEEMAQLTEELKRSNKELEAFSYSVSHDLRAPFRHIVGFAEFLKEHEAIADDQRAQRYVDTIIEAAFSAGRLVDDLLGFSQMGRASLAPIRVDMNKLVDEVRRMLRPEIGDRTIKWQVADLSPAVADPSFLRSVWQNLISNAIKYTRDAKDVVIEIGSEPGNGETVYFVRDNGVGFDMAYVDKLFGVFQRLHRVEDYEGSGIGLANVRRIVERHGGRTWAEGEVGRGATFYFSLPDPAKESTWPN
ncbi:ATP-binding protein [Jiella sp. M17.18]|uniref:ATP-binding protein n=1 Tax=Jiella sp. M17.18 TaxID=3234247 RepID=UPI0034DF0455